MNSPVYKRSDWLCGVIVCALVEMLVLPRACASDAVVLCGDRTGGAVIDFDIAGETLKVWITDDVFIDEAMNLLAAGKQRVAIFQLIDGRDCDPQWSWHVEPSNPKFADLAMELCDGLPSFVEKDKEYWLRNVGSFCPWTAKVMQVDDRRVPPSSPIGSRESDDSFLNHNRETSSEIDISAYDRLRAQGIKTGKDKP